MQHIPMQGLRCSMGCAAGAHSEAPRACRPTHAPFSGTSAAGPRFATEAPCSKAPCGRYRKLVVAQAGFKGFGQRPSKAAKQGAKQGAACPCGSGKSYADCCQRYHKGELPQTAEALMRSRFVAYVNSDAGYVVETTHPDNPQFGGTFKPDGTLSSTLRQDAQATCDSLKFEQLDILLTEDPGPDEAYVTFRAHFRLKGQQGQRAQGSVKKQSFVERSRFLRVDGRWLYVDGEQDWDEDEKKA